jgi:hypothetical protein
MKAIWFDKENGTVAIFCPGCNQKHYLNVDPKNGRPCWGFNGNFEKPTFTPSLLVRTGKHVEGEAYKQRLPKEDWAAYEQYSKRCHSFITDGMIKFLGDCTHDLKDKTVPLPEIDNPKSQI